jgi:hypothetical protein
MKTTITKFFPALFIAAVAITLSSFTGSKKTEPASTLKTEIIVNDYAAVREFVTENITVKIREHRSPGELKVKSFSRCPSGYQSRIISSADSTKVNMFVYGKINLYKGCSPQHVCDFRVHVEKGIAEVKNKDDKDYISVREWLELNPASKEETPAVKESAKEVKG